jgi:hypothetical protein
VISSLSHLVRASAISAIVDGTEKITRDLMDGIRLDHAVEDTAPQPARRKRPAS